MLEMGVTKAFASITVTDLITQAGVSRSTFYDNYADRETLLLETLEAEVLSHERELTPDDAVESDKDQAKRALFAFLHHVERNVALYRSAIGEHGSATVIHRLRTGFEEQIGKSMSKVSADKTLPNHVVAAAISGIVMGVLLQWIETDPLPSADVVSVWIWKSLPHAPDREPK